MVSRDRMQVIRTCLGLLFGLRNLQFASTAGWHDLKELGKLDQGWRKAAPFRESRAFSQRMWMGNSCRLFR